MVWNLDSYLELLNIFKKKVLDNEWILNISPDVLENWFRINHAKFVHYGRDMELLFSYCKVVHGRRIYGEDIELRKRLTIEDIQRGFKQFSNHTNNNIENPNIYGLYV